MLIEGADYFVRLVDFPVGAGCDGAITPNDDGTYSIYLDARTTFERQKKAFKHELDHANNNDFYNDKDIEAVENL